MLRIASAIRIIRNPNRQYPERNGTLYFNTFNSIKINKSWDKITQTAEFVLPKNLRSIKGFDKYGNVFDAIKNNLGRTTDTVNGPLIMRGDFIDISIGYLTDDNTADSGMLTLPELTGGSIILAGTTDTNTNFNGYVSSANISYATNTSKIIIKCEDYMYYLQRVRVKDKTFLPGDPSKAGLYDVQKMLNEMFNWDNIKLANKGSMTDLPVLPPLLRSIKGKGTYSEVINEGSYTQTIYKPNFIINSSGGTNLGVQDDASSEQSYILGKFICQNATIGMVFKELNQKFHIKVFLQRDDRTINCGPYVYSNIPYTKQVANTTNGVDNVINSAYGYKTFAFTFGENIIEDKLEYKNLTDVPAGCIVKSLTKVPTSETTKSGTIKTVVKQKSRFVGSPGGNLYNYIYFNTTDKANTIPTDAQLESFGRQQLLLNNYNGFKGSFTVFGYPYVLPGDTINLIDPIYKDKNGSYKVKSVEYKASVEGGLRQEITLHMLIPNTLFGANAVYDPIKGIFVKK